MKHTLKHQGPGAYTYRGWVILRHPLIVGSAKWVAYREDDPTWILDPLPTLRATKQAIDARPDPEAEARRAAGYVTREGITSTIDGTIVAVDGDQD